MKESKQSRANAAGLAVLVILAVSVSTNASWCFIVRPGASQAFEESKAVFIGEVVKITKVDDATGKKLKRVIFNVEYSWKGAGFQELGMPGLSVLSSEDGLRRCEWDGYIDGTIAFEEGKKYLVYATETPEKELFVGPGTRTMRIEKAAEDLKQLRTFDLILSMRPKHGLVMDKPFVF